MRARPPAPAIAVVRGRTYNRPTMKLGYIASHIFRHTFEINEASEVRRLRPGTRVYSFHAPAGQAYQRERIAEMGAEIVTPGGEIAAFLRMLAQHPVRVFLSAVNLAARSLPNPIYWFKSPIVFMRAMSLIEDIERQGITHLHASFGSSPATVAWLARQILDITYSITFHSFDVYSTQLQYRDPLRREKLRRAVLVVAVHEAARKILLALVPDQDPRKFEMIRVSVTFDPAPKAQPLPEPPLLLAVGNLVDEKGFDILIRGVAILRSRGIAVRARILGDGVSGGALEALVQKKAVGDCVEMRGFFPHAELKQHMAEAAALLAPCRVARHGLRDGIPTVVVEAWLGRTPVVASLVGGMPEVIIDGETGVVFASEEPESLADAVERLLSDAELRGRIVESGRRMALDAFSPGKNAGRLVELIEERAGHRRI